MIFAIQYLLILPFVWLAKFLPRSLLLSMGRCVGMGIYYLLAGRRKLAVRNICMTLGVSEGEAKQIAQKNFSHFGMVAMEMLRIIAKSATKERIKALFPDLQPPMEKLKELNRLHEGRVIYVTAHLGNWEYFGSIMGIMGYPFTVIGRSINNPYIDKMVTESREMFGSRLVDKEGALLALAKELKAGRPVGLLPDQKSNDRTSAKLDFLGHQAGTTLGVAKLAKRFNAALIPIAVVMNDDLSYTLCVDDPIAYRADESDEETMQKVNDHLGEMIRTYPAQWFWMHNRWKQ